MSSTILYFDQTLQTILYVIDIELYGADDALSVGDHFFYDSFQAILQVARVFKLYRQGRIRHHENPTNKNIPFNDSTKIITVKSDDIQKAYPGKFDKYLKAENSADSSTLCLCSKSPTELFLSRLCHFLCVKDSWNASDLTESEDLVTSSCFRIFETERDCGTSFSAVAVLYIFVAVFWVLLNA